MLALVIAWSGYLAGLRWLVATPDPWLVKSTAHKNTAQPVAKQRGTEVPDEQRNARRRSSSKNGWWLAETDRQDMEGAAGEGAEPSDHTPDLEKWQDTHTH
jgi:hypothetical protein